MTDTRPFQVDLKGVVDLLGRHIYSSPRVYLRELLQNGVDAISARREHAQAERTPVDDGWGITITPADEGEGDLVLTDEGVGLTATEVADLLATVGRSSKRDIFDLRRTDYLGQFGIGLFSCFMVSDQIRVLSRSARGGEGVEWVGSADGTFTVTPCSGLPVGTTVRLRPRFDTGDLLSGEVVEQIGRHYGEFLPVPIQLRRAGRTIRLTRPAPFLEPEPARDELWSYAEEALLLKPMATISLKDPATLTTGTAFVLPFAPPPAARPTVRMYLGRMLLSERTEDLLPDWAFFVRAVANSNGLTPTASRENLVDDLALQHTREQFSNSIRSWLMDLAVHHPVNLDAFLHVHETAIKQLILHDEEMAGVFLGWLSLETSGGWARIDRLVHRHPRLRYAPTLDEFRQIAPITPKDEPLINGGYVYDSELCELIPMVYPSVTVERADVLSELDRLDPPGLDERPTTLALEERASAVLESRECQVVVRLIGADDVPGLFVADPEVFRHIDRDRASSAGGSGLWSQILAQTDAFALDHRSAGDRGHQSRLCLNWRNPLVRSLAGVEDSVVFDRCVRLLYVQSQLASHRPLSAGDRQLMTSALTDLIALSTRQPPETGPAKG